MILSEWIAHCRSLWDKDFCLTIRPCLFLSMYPSTVGSLNLPALSVMPCICFFVLQGSGLQQQKGGGGNPMTF